MTPEKALDILEGRIPHKSPRDHVGEKKIPHLKNIQEGSVNTYASSKIWLIILILGALGVCYLWMAGFMVPPPAPLPANSNIGQTIQLQQELSETRQNLELVTRQKDRLVQSLDSVKKEINEKEKPTPLKTQVVTSSKVQKPASSGNNSFSQAISGYTKAIEINPNDIDARLNRGLAYESKNNYELALPDFNKIIEIAPGFIKAYTARGIAYEGMGQYDKALNDFNKAIKIDPQDTIGFYRRGDIYFLKGNYTHAISNWSRAVKLDSQNPASGINYYRKADFNKIISDNTNVIRVYPGYFLAYYMRGIAYGAKGYHDKAISDFSKVIELNPKYVDAYKGRSIAYFMKQDYNKALEDMEKVQQSGGVVNPNIINSLKIASGKT